MAKRSNEFTHDNSPAKNVWLTIRAAFNIVAFFVLFFSIATGAKWYFTALGAALVAVAVTVNMVIPYFKRKR